MLATPHQHTGPRCGAAASTTRRLPGHCVTAAPVRSPLPRASTLHTPAA